MPIKEKTGKTLVLIDAHAILHRAYHALPDFTSSKGEPTGGLYGLSTMLMRIISELKPDYIAACYDRPEATFRKEAYDAYKAQRKKADDALIAQMDRSRDIFTAFSIPIYDQAGFEADDIIGTIVEQTKKDKNLSIIIASGDMDTMQLISGQKVKVYTLKKGLNETILYDEDQVRTRFGFGPELLPDYKGLRGDPSDNIVGVAGIGEKTASTLIQNFGSLEDIFKKLKKDEEAFKQAGLSERIIKLLKENEDEALFSKMLATIRRDVPLTFNLGPKWVDSFNSSSAEKIFRDLEFKTLAPRAAALVKNVKGQADVAKSPVGSEANAGFTQDRLTKLSLALWLVSSDLTTPTETDILDYAGTDSLVQAEEKIMAELHVKKLTKVFTEIELPLIPIIAEAERRGILVDKTYLQDLSEKYHQELTHYEDKIYDLAGEKFNLNSPKKLGEILFDKMQISVKGLKKTAGGARSTRESELEKLRAGNPIIAEILEYRGFQKLLSTYVDNLPQMLDAHNRLHTKLNQAGTTTGRMSSSNPNLQNIPARGEHGAEIRRAFMADTGSEFLSFDYSQIEIRVLAQLAGETELIKVFKEGKDVHASVAAKVFKVPETEVTKDMRRRAKVINFGIIYGMGVNALKTNLGSTREEAQEFYDNFFATFPKIREYFDRVIQGAYKNGYTETLFGRRRYFPGLKSPLPYVRANAERMAMNAPLQGTAADIVKLSMIEVDHALKKQKLDEQVFLLLQIHDELLYEVRSDAVVEAKKIIEAVMSREVLSEVPLEVHLAAGKRWGEME